MGPGAAGAAATQRVRGKEPQGLPAAAALLVLELAPGTDMSARGSPTPAASPRSGISGAEGDEGDTALCHLLPERALFQQGSLEGLWAWWAEGILSLQTKQGTSRQRNALPLAASL